MPAPALAKRKKKTVVSHHTLPSPPPLPPTHTPPLPQAAKGGEEGGKVFDRSVYGIVASNANFSMMGSALTSAGFEAELTGTGPFTVFAANDDVFGDALKSLGTTKLELLNLPALPTILKNHVVKGSVLAADLKEGSEIETLGGTKLKVTAGPCINGFPLVKKDIKATNGILHSIKGVIA